MNYYNEFDPYAAQWLRNLIAAGAIPDGHVDQRSITEVKPEDLAGFVQCHFFAGIAGWSLALKLAGIDPSTPLWTGSCPCQPFSAAGKRKGTADERHLWPVFRDLIAQCKPPIVFGEQVASADGRAWLSTVRAEMEALGYAVGAADMCAAGIGAPHLRQRLYFVGLGNTTDQPCERNSGSLPGTETAQHGTGIQIDGSLPVGSEHAGASLGRLADADDQRPQGRIGVPQRAGQCSAGEGSVEHSGRPGTADSFWSSADWLFCRDGKWRPIEPGTQPLAHGVPRRVAHLRGYGNAIVPQVAATFIRAALPERKTD